MRAALLLSLLSLSCASPSPRVRAPVLVPAPEEVALTRADPRFHCEEQERGTVCYLVEERTTITVSPPGTLTLDDLEPCPTSAPTSCWPPAGWEHR